MDKKYLLIFDWDGVIADSGTYFLEVYNKVCSKFGREFHIKNFKEFQQWYDSKWENNFYRLGFSPEELPPAMSYVTEIVKYDDVKLFPEAIEMLLQLKKDYNMAVASTTPSYKIKKKLEEEKLTHLFSFISGGEDRKSEKVMKILKVVDYFNIAPENCIMVGDTVMDMVSASEVGIKGIAITCGWNSRDRLEEVSPYLVVDTHEELLSSVYNIFPLEK